MGKLNPEKLSVEFRDGVTSTKPIIRRRYTLTHSDVTAELFLTIGLKYAYDKINNMRDEVLGEWIKNGETYSYYVYLNVDIDGQFGPEAAAIRDFIFRRELPLALEAIRYGDKEFFSAHPELDNSPIIVFFMSTYPKFNKVENWGTFSNYVLRGFNT
jgi:Staygreen protein